MKLAITFSLLSVVLIFWACYVDVYEIGSSSSSTYYSEAYSDPQHHSSSSVEIKLQDSLKGQVQSYKTIKIGSLIWMAQNLNEMPRSGNWWCYKDEYCNVEKPDEICRSNQDCIMYGKLYDWEAAMNACPSGWRLPSKEDFDDLSKSLLSDVMLFRDSWWNATLGGCRKETGTIPCPLTEGYWWSSYTSGNLAYYAYYQENGTTLDGNYFVKTRGLSVRCVK